ncbi:ATP-binding cassette domain-containing protein [Nonomuraea sp. NPDC052634]|uniref:ABC-F family ATP-binding cassette domain-containing protein n=1 Tax=Nonomuraea sp. NPDC052634 TaxID=3155813 RepID=UPI00344388B9
MSVSVRTGERVGIVGENGSGKSTLMRLLAGVERPDEGEVHLTSDLGYVAQTLAETLGLPPGSTVQEAVDAALADLRAMERRMRELESALAEEASQEVMDEYGELCTAYELRGGYEADARVDRAFHGLGLAHVGRERTLGSLSGGEQARLGLACVLAAAPRALLLDEPTNHLDESALTWLEDRLREHRGAVAVVSHDRVFLDRVATAIVEVEQGAVTRFGGGYTGYLAAKAAARARWEQAYAAWCAEVRQVREHAATTAHRVAAGRAMRDNNKMAYDRNAGRVQSSIASRVRNAHERLRRLEADPVPRPPDPLHFRATFGPAPTPPPDTTSDTPAMSRTTTDAQTEAARTQQPGTGTSAQQPGPHALAGSTPTKPTGTTALRQQAGMGARAQTVPAPHRPGASNVTRDRRDDRNHQDNQNQRNGQDGQGDQNTDQVLVRLRNVRVGDRLQVEELTIKAGERILVKGGNGAGKSTLLGVLADQARCRVGYLPQEVSFDPALPVLEAYGEGHPDERRAALLATGLFRPHTLDQRVGELSVGQQRRLALAKLLAREHDLLLLDEPTNHLSPLLAEELERALDGYHGTLVMVSHDRALVRRFRGREIELAGGRIL